MHACGVCRTDLHVVDGELPDPKLPARPRPRDRRHASTHSAPASRASRVGAARRRALARLDLRALRHCRAAARTSATTARFTGYQLDGGYAEYAVADARYCFPLPERYADAQAAPLLCAGLIGYRALAAWRATPDASASTASARRRTSSRRSRVAQGREVFAFTRPGDAAAQAFARELGAHWAGDSDAAPPEPLDAAIIFAPVGALVPAALRRRAQGRHGGLRRHPHERHPGVPLRSCSGASACVRSVANLTRRDGEEFLALAATIPVGTGRALSAGARQRRAGAAARRCHRGRRRIDASRLKASNEPGGSISTALRRTERDRRIGPDGDPSVVPPPTHHRSNEHGHEVRTEVCLQARSHRQAGPEEGETGDEARPEIRPEAAPKSTAKAPDMFTLPDAAQLAEYAKTLTPEQAFELYRANAKLALDVIDAAIESTAKMRRLQFEGEESARTMQKKAARRAAEAGDVPALMAAGQSVSQEAIERSMAYWGQMFDLVVEMQKRLFALMENQMSERAGREAGQGGDGHDARHDADAERRFGDAGRDVVGRLGVRVDAEGDGRLRPDVRSEALTGLRIAACAAVTVHLN